MIKTYVLIFSSVRTGPFGRDIVTERRIQSPSWHTLQTISGPLEDAGYTCMIFEQQSNNNLGPVGATA
jgi:hypothetical protein